MEINTGYTQTITLHSGSRTAKLWFKGNGVSPYLVQSAVLTQGSVSVSVKCLKQTSFYVPPLGRWSDLVSLSGFTLPGVAYFTSVVKGEVSVTTHSEGTTTSTQPVGISGTGIVDKVESTTSTTTYGGDELLILNFDGTNLSTTYTEEVSGLVPVTNSKCAIDTSWYKFGSGSLNCASSEVLSSLLKYNGISGLTNSFTVHCWLKIDNYATDGLRPSSGFQLLSADEQESFGFTIAYDDTSAEPTNTWRALFNFDNGTSSDEGWSDTLLENTVYHIAIVANGSVAYLFINGVKKLTLSLPYTTNLSSYSIEVVGGATIHFDAIEVLNYAKWTSNFSVPTSAPATSGVPNATTGEITLTSQPVAGDTLTIGSTTYTFVNRLTGAANEILIGSTLAETLQNIADALNNGESMSASSDGTTITFTDSTSADTTVTSTVTGLNTTLYVTSLANTPTEVIKATQENGIAVEGCLSWFNNSAHTFVLVVGGVTTYYVFKKYAASTVLSYHYGQWYAYSSTGYVDASGTVTTTTPTSNTIFSVDPTNLTGADIITGEETLAERIAKAINSTPGGMFFAEVVDDYTCYNVVTNATAAYRGVKITAYTDETFEIWYGGSAGIASSIPVIDYLSNDSAATIPAFTVYGEATQRGDVGAIYGIEYIPQLTATGSASQSGIFANATLPVFTATGNTLSSPSFDLPTVHGSSTSTDAVLKSLLLYNNAWMVDFTSGIIVNTLPDKIALEAVQFVATNITYATDLSIYGETDYWANPWQTIAMGSGDCEDGALLTASLMINAGVPTSNVRIYIGETLGESHAWVMYKRTSDNQWVTLDWTKGSTVWDAVDSVSDLTALYPSIEAIVDNNYDSDDYAYGSATKYFDASYVTSLANIGAYLDSLESDVYSASLEAVLPMLYPTLSGGGELKITLPSLVLAFNSSKSEVGKLLANIPRFKVSMTGYDSISGTLSVTLPSILCDITGQPGTMGQLEIDIPKVTFTATGIIGIVGQMEAVLPSMTADFNSYWMGTNSLSAVLPSLQFNVNVSGLTADFLTLVMNTKNFALTNYSSYNYNSLFYLNGKLCGLKSTGLYELSGDTDDGVNVEWSFKTGKLDTHKDAVSKVRYAWFSLKCSGDLIFTIDDGDNTYEYDVESFDSNDTEVRVKLGKGIRNRYLQLQLENVDGEKLNLLDHIRLFSNMTESKR